jgi:hypothetical protein
MAGVDNLKPWPKGVSGNPGGTVRLPPELRAARRENMSALIRIIHQYVGITEEQAKERLCGPEALQLEEMIQGQISKAKEGDTNAFKFLIEVMCGKIPEADHESATETLTPQDKLQMMKEAVKVLEAQVVKSESRGD